MSVSDRLLKRVHFALREPAYSFVIAGDRRWLLRQFRDILANSREYVYLSLTSRSPVLLGDDFRDLILNSLCGGQSGLDFRALIRKGWSRSLGFYDASFRVTDKSVGNFLVGDGGALIIAIWSGHRFDVRRPDKDEDIKRKFLDEYERARLAG